MAFVWSSVSSTITITSLENGLLQSPVGTTLEHLVLVLPVPLVVLLVVPPSHGLSLLDHVLELLEGMEDRLGSGHATCDVHIAIRANARRRSSISKAGLESSDSFGICSSGAVLNWVGRSRGTSH